MITINTDNFKFVEEDTFIENTALNYKVKKVLIKIGNILLEIDFNDFDVMVILSGQLYNSAEPFRFVEYDIIPNFTPDDVQNEIQKVLGTEIATCLGHLKSYPKRKGSQ